MSSASNSKSRVPAMESPTSYRLCSSQTLYFSSKSAFCTLSAIRTESRRRAACAVTDAKPTGSKGGFSSTRSASVSSRAVSGIVIGGSAGGSTPRRAELDACRGSTRTPRSERAAVRRAARIPSKSRPRSENGSSSASLWCAARIAAFGSAAEAEGRGIAALLGLAPEPGEGGLGSGEDARILGQPHDLEGLLDRGRQPAESELSPLIEQLLQNLDENGDADRIDDLRLLEVEEEAIHARPQESVSLLRDFLASGVVDVTVRAENGDVDVRPVHDHFQGLAHPVLYTSTILAHDDACAVLAALDPDVVHQALDDLDAPAPLPAGPQRGGDFGGLEPGRIKPMARVCDVDLEIGAPAALLGTHAEGELYLAVGRRAVLERVDAGFDDGHLHLVDLVAAHLHPLAERRDLRRGGDLHFRRDRNGHMHLSALDRRHRFSAIPSQSPRTSGARESLRKGTQGSYPTRRRGRTRRLRREGGKWRREKGESMRGETRVKTRKKRTRRETRSARARTTRVATREPPQP